MAMRLVQYDDRGRLTVALVGDDGTLEPLAIEGGTHALAQAAIAEGGMAAAIEARRGGARVAYDEVAQAGMLLPPLTHPDQARCLVSGTGLTHLGSADTRESMHVPLEAGASDSMKMFRMGLEGGKPAAGQVGAQPEWFYKGDGACVVAPGAPLGLPDFAQDGGEEPELVGLYVVGPDGTPCRVGFAIGNEYSDHVTERVNYLWLAHSKLRDCAFGPELRIGPAPDDIRGTSSVRRGGQVVWSKPFATGEANMSHSLANLEHHHFKYPGHRRPGDVHVHFFGTAVLSFADQVKLEPGDVMEISAEGFGRALANPLGTRLPAEAAVVAL
jgi:hypothetical protein